MADASDATAFDVARFFAEATELVERARRGESGLLTLRRLVNMGHWMLGADGVAVVEFGPITGRIVAASGTATEVLGRRVDSADERLLELLADDVCVVCSMKSLPADLRVMSRESNAALVGRISRGTGTVGMFVACLPDKVSDVDDLRQRAHRLLTTVGARLYRDSPGLPLHPDPTLRIRPEPSAVVDRLGIVRWTNPASQTVLSAAGVSVGQPLTLPMPGPGQVLEHNLPDGRTLTLSAKTWPDRSDVSLTVRDITES